MLKMVNHFLHGGFFPCSAIDQLPDLDFHLGNHKFTLKPEDYMVAMDTSAEETARLRLMHTRELARRTELSAVDDTVVSAGRRRSSGFWQLVSQLMSNESATSPLNRAHPYSTAFGSGICVPAMTDLDELTNMGPMVILGVPFMRAFHATFSRKGVNEGTITLGKISRNGDVCSSCESSQRVEFSSEVHEVTLSNVIQPRAPLVSTEYSLRSRHLPVVRLSQIRMSSSIRGHLARRHNRWARQQG
jgi:hypothetical protein